MEERLCGRRQAALLEPSSKKGRIISSCRGQNCFFAVPSVLLLNLEHSWGLFPESPGFNQPWVPLQPRLWASNASPLSTFSWSNTLKPQSSRAPLAGSARCLCPALLASAVWGGGCGGCTGLLPGGMYQPGFPGYTLSCSYLHSGEPQPGLFLADLFIWVLHCCRPRLSFCRTCARVHKPGSSRHMGGVPFYPKSPSGIDNCLTEHQGEKTE